MYLNTLDSLDMKASFYYLEKRKGISLKSLFFLKRKLPL